MKTKYVLLIAAVATLILIFTPYDWFNGRSFIFDYYEMKHNEIGDFIGGITAPVLSIVTIWLVYKTYKSQKRELSDTKTALKLQQSTQSLFSMLNILEKIIDAIRSKVPYATGLAAMMTDPTQYVGHDYLREGYLWMRGNARKGESSKYQYHPERKVFFLKINGVTQEGKDLSVSAYEDMLGKELKIMFIMPALNLSNHYFRYITAIFKFIQNEFTEGEQRDYYYQLFRAQLSPEEIALIYYYSMTDLDYELRNIIVPAKLLAQFDKEVLIKLDHWFIFASKLPEEPKNIVV